MAILEVGREPVEQPRAARATETTRLLCAAAYTEPTFAQEVVAELVEEEYRAVSVPPGVDPEPVLKHCLAAVRRKTVRDRLLAATLVVGLLLFGVGLVLGFFVAWAIVAYDLWSATYGVAKNRLSRDTFDPAEAPAASAEHARRIEQIVGDSAGNLTVYSGFLPFASAGTPLGGWSFVVDLRKGKEDEKTGDRLEPQPVQPLDLYAGVERSLRALGMGNLTIEDQAFVSGTDIRDDRALLPSPIGRPGASVTDAALQRLIVAPTHRVRHYTCIQVTDWRGELVLSLFVRFAVANGRLFCELSECLLRPLKAELHRVDGLPPQPELQDLLWLARRSFRSTLPLWLRSPAVVVRPLLRERRRTKLRKWVERDPFFDYGAAVSALDRVRSTRYSRYFQVLDKDMHEKVLERTILDTIIDVLDDHDVDTAELAERRSTIINHGIMMREGSSLNTDNLAVGAGATVFQRVTGSKQASTGSGSGSGGSASNA